MNSSKNYLIALLAVATLGLGYFSYQQYTELVKLRAAALSNNERADLQKRLWDSEKRRQDLEGRLASAAKPAPAPEAGEPGAQAERRRVIERGANGFMNMMDNPEVQKLMAVQQKGALDNRYSALFKSLHLSPQDLEKFKSLLVDKQTAIMDVMAAARAQGLNGRDSRDEMRKAMGDAQAEIDTNIKAALGDAGYAQYKQYEQTLPQRSVVDQLDRRLSYTDTPLTPEQTDKMVQILAANAPQRATPAGNVAGAAPAVIGANVTVATTQVGGGEARTMVVSGPAGGPPGLALPGAAISFGGPSTQITPAAVTQAQSVLNAQQLAALQQLQQEQQAQAALAQTMRANFEANRGGPNGPTTVTVPAQPVTTPKPGGGG